MLYSKFYPDLADFERFTLSVLVTHDEPTPVVNILGDSDSLLVRFAHRNVSPNKHRHIFILLCNITFVEMQVHIRKIVANRAYDFIGAIVDAFTDKACYIFDLFVYAALFFVEIDAYSAHYAVYRTALRRYAFTKYANTLFIST